MNNKMILLLVTLLVLLVGVASAGDVSDDTLAADSADIVQDAPTIDNAVSVTTEIVDNNVSKKANDNQMNYHENDDVAVSKDTTTIQDTTDKNMKTATQVNVYNYDQLVNSVNDARYSNTDEYVINLRYGNYYANTALGWGEATGTTRKLVINGNGNTLDGQNEHFFIETIPGYSLVLNNIKLTNYAYESAAVIFNHGGEVTINSSTFTSNRATDNGAVIYNSFGGKINIISSNFTGNSAKYGAVIYNDNATVNITSSIFENNCANTEGGVIYSKNNAIVNIISSNFTNNSIDSEGSGNALGGVIVNSNSTMNISYSNFIKNNATVGGVIFNQLSDISIASSNFTDNNANYGGVFYNIYGGVNLTYSNFTNNRATIAGGVGYITNGSVNFAYSNLISNNATSGGAVYALNASVNILNSNVTSNNATNGGVLYNDGAKINIASSNFTSNSASNQGGVLFNNIGNVTINSSNFTSNSATGGGVIMVYYGSITINNTNFNVNHANEGGVLFNFDGNVQVISDNFISNTADNIGGAIVNREGVVNVTSSKFIKNTAGQRGSIYNDRTLSLDNSVFYENVPLNFELVEHDGDYTLNYKPDGFISFGSIAIYSDANVTPFYTGSFNDMDIPIGNHTLRMVINGTDPTIFRDNTFIFKKGEYIDSINVSDYQSLVNAVGCAKSCESDIFTINLLPGNYIATASMTWGDAYGSTRKLIINGNGLTLDGNATHQFMNVKDGYELELNNITITNYTASAGSVIDNEGTVKITDSILTKNVAADVGGVIFNKGTGIIDIDRCNLTNNSATNGGGVIYTIGNSTVNINSSNFTDNNASDFQSLGGAIFNNENCTVNINLSRFTNNCAGFNGGSVLYSMGTVNINNSVIADNNVPDRGVITNWGLLNIGYSNFTNNTSQGTAGVLCNGFGGNANIISSNFKDNSATSEGGVIYTYDDISIENTNFTNNSACDGGAIYKLTGTITINHADFIDNRATNNGGAIKNNGDLYIRYVNFINNTAVNYGGAIYGYMGPKISYCNFTGNTPSDFIIRNGRIELNQEVYIDVYAFQIYLDDEDTPVYGGSEAYGGSLSDYSVVKGHNIRLVVYDQYEDNFHDNVFYLDQVSYDSAVHNYDELVEAVEAAKGFDGDNFTIVLLPGNYNATSNMTWADATGTTRKLIIEGNGLTLDGKDRYQFMNLTSGYTLELSNITLTRYNATNGGAIYNHGGNVTVTDAIFINDSSTYKGGAIYNEAGSVMVNNTNFTGNRANEYDGGALYNYDGNLIVINSNFTNNVGGYSGGAIYDYNGSVTVTGSTFTANNGTIHSGGAIASVIDGGSLDISDSKFINNIASKGGGAIYVEGFMNITGSNFTNNTATERGGAIYNYYRSNVNVTGSNFINNTAIERGGAIYNHAYSNVNVTGSNFINNTATDCGGAIYNYNYSNVNVTGSNFTKNNATKFGGAIHNDYYSNATITGSNFTQNNATWGGAIGNYNNSNVNVTGSNFINNTATELGGAIYYNNSNANVTGSNFINNTATERGGAIYKEGGSVKSSDSTFYGNTPSNYVILDDDGQYSIKLENDDGFITTGNVAIYVDDETIPSYVGDNLDDFTLPFGKHTIKLVVNGTDLSKFSNNTFILDSDVSLDNIDVSDYQSLFDAVEYAKTTNYDNVTINLLAGNYNATVDMTWADATGTVRKIIINGNGITLDGNNTHQFMQVASGYTLILNNITFVNYTAAKGAVVDNYGTLCINNSNFTHNTATQYGGAIYNNNIGDVNVTNSRFYGNTPSNYVITNENGPYVIKLDSDDSFIDMDTVAIYLDDETAPRYVGSDLNEYILPLGEHTITLVVNGTNQDTFTNNTFIMDANIDTNNVAVSDYDGLAAMVEYAKTSRYTNFTINLLPGDYNATCDMFWGETTYRYLTLTIEGNGIILNGNFTHQFMHVNYGYGLKLNNITLTNYTSKYGGAINNGGNVTVTASNITHNNATYGGAIYNSHNLVIVNSNITYNNASDGGAIYNYRDTYVVAISNINDSNLTYNYASNGGAVYNLGIFAVTDSNLTYNNASYGGAINNGGNVTVTGSNLTYNNVTDYGGAISVDSGNVEVASSKFTDNHARRGSAISIVRGSLGVTSSKFTDNYASGNGGVIYNFEGNVSISSSNFTNNSALFYSGAAIYNYGNINISLSNFTDNRGYDGGAIVNCLNANVTSSNFINNSASNDGGAIWNGHNGNINITSSNFTDNNASRGGAVHNGMNVVVTINNSSFINNSANYDGGAIYNDEGEIAVMNSNFTANTPENFLIQDKKIDLIDNDSYIDVDVVSVYLDDDTCVYTGSLDGYTVPSNHTIRLVVNGSDTNTFCNN
ncbi:MAG: hypothetical protein Q4Q22_01055, partial [Methanosphaera sp.]|nr:hypothetical protein [Methanosphaera sp.]